MQDLDMKKLRQDYYYHLHRCKRKRDAAGNPVEMKLTFDEWLQIWLESGKLHLRGNRRGCFVMSRKNDLGHYELGNVFIQSTENNIRDANAGKKHTEAFCAKISVIKSKPCTIDGITIYSSFNALRAALGQGKSGTRSPNLRYVEKKSD